MSAIAALGYTTQTYSFRQLLADHGETGRVLAWVGQLAQSIEESQGLQDRRVNAEANGGIALFYTLKRGSARKGTIGDYRRGQAASPSRIANVLPKLPESSTDGRGRAVRGRHGVSFLLLKEPLM
jgi:hypothetical protein